MKGAGLYRCSPEGISHAAPPGLACTTFLYDLPYPLILPA